MKEKRGSKSLQATFSLNKTLFVLVSLVVLFFHTDSANAKVIIVKFHHKNFIIFIRIAIKKHFRKFYTQIEDMTSV